MMTNQVSLVGEDFTVDAGLLGTALGIDPALVPELMRSGQITSRCETGVDEDAGTYRLTFYHALQAVRLTVDSKGRILKQARFATPGRNPTPG